MFQLRNNRRSDQRIEGYGNSEKRVAVTILFFVTGLLGISFLIPSPSIAQDFHYRQDSLFQEKVPFRVVSWNIEIFNAFL